MFALDVNLQDGFNDDTVIIKINNDEIFRKEHVKTDIRIGLAAKFTTDLNSGPVHVQVAIPTKDLTGKYKFTINSKMYLGISILESDSPVSKIGFLLSQEAFAYF